MFNFTTGEYPFEGDTIFKLFENIGKGEFTVPQSVSFMRCQWPHHKGRAALQVDKVLETLLRWMLATEAGDRPDMQAILAHDWCRKRFPRFGGNKNKRYDLERRWNKIRYCQDWKSSLRSSSWRRPFTLYNGTALCFESVKRIVF